MSDQLAFATTNVLKFEIAQQVCAQHNIKLLQKPLNLTEIQDEIAENVAIAKAKSAFKLSNSPVVITDDSWNFPGLGGFPGAFMHSINTWFTAEDFLRLTSSLTDRRAILTQCLVYCDGLDTKLFKRDSIAQILDQKKGTSEYPSHMVISFEQDKGKSIAEVFSSSVKRTERDSAQVWHDFILWYKQKSRS